jgi:anti-anti-sigma factor
MHNKQSQLPQDIYHRLYWYAQRNVDPKRIAGALNLPIKTVMHLIDKLKSEKQIPDNETPKDQKAREGAREADKSCYVDVFMFAKTRYTIIDISGNIDKNNTQKMREELIKLVGADRKPLALKMADVWSIDESGIMAIKTLYTGIKHQGRYCAILDPSPAMEEGIKKFGLDETIPVFGTEIAFEEHAFRISHG